MDIILIGVVLATCLWLWLTVLSILCLMLDPDLNPIQRWGQALVVLLVPYLGSTLILKLVNDHSPDVIARFYIPWPFSLMILDRKLSRNGLGSNGEEIPGSHSAGINSGHSSGSDGGGSD